MKLKTTLRTNKGYALIVMMMLAAVSLLILGGALRWTSSTASNTDRNNIYFDTLAAAEAATEKVVARISRDFQTHGEGVVYASLPVYRTLLPTSAEDEYWNNFNFNNGGGTENRTHVERLTAWGYTNLNSQYAGLKAMASTYRIVSNARTEGSSRPMTAALKQEIQIASIPVFQFAIFYTMDLEINPGPDMTINGRVHSNGEIYTRPNSSVTYLDHVTAVRNINLFQSPMDPSTRPTDGVVKFKSEHDARVSSLTLPIGTNNSPAAVHSVVEIPSWSESPSSPMGKQRYFNKADVVMLYSDSGIAALARNHLGVLTPIPAAQFNTFASTNSSHSFYNKREGKTVKTIELCVECFKIFSEGYFRGHYGNSARNANTIYIADTRTLPSNSQSGIRVVNGETLPSGGLTIATRNPIYVKGDFNSPASTRGTSNTAGTKPSSIVADSITILSDDWNDSEGHKSLSYRKARNTTVNAAFLGGIVASDGVYYSGGVENFPRFLENWSGRTFTYNGSMVVMFYSQISNAPWPGTGDVYNPPNRNWAFDVNFMDATKLPPGTPQLLTTIRGKWEILPPNTIL
mgnify:FL=1